MDTPDTFWSLFAGYSVFWILIAGFALRLMVEQRGIASRLQQLEERRSKGAGN